MSARFFFPFLLGIPIVLPLPSQMSGSASPPHEEQAASLCVVCPSLPSISGLLLLPWNKSKYPNPISLSILTPDVCTAAAQDVSCSFLGLPSV